MRKRNRFFLFLTIGFLSVSTAISQPFGNEWINFNQEYFKIEVEENGIYRLTFDQLNNAGFPVSTIDPRRIQIFSKGIEQAIHIEGQSDGNFDTGDYIDFYGEKNDGSTDTELYVSPEAQPHTYYNLFSDKGVYYLTYKLSSESGIRIDSFFENNVDGIAEEASYTHEMLELFTNNYNEGQSYSSGNEVVLSQYDLSEGWNGDYVSRGSSLNYTFTSVINGVTSSGKPTLEVLLVGGNNNAHNGDVLAGPSSAALRSLGSVDFNKDEHILFSSEIEWADISASGELVVNVSVNGVSGQADRMAFAYVKLSYPRTFDLANADRQVLALDANGSGKSFIRVDNPMDNSHVWDITDPSTPLDIGLNSSFQEFTAVVPNTVASRTLLVQAQTLAVSNLEIVSFQSIDPSSVNYFIITNEALRQPTTSGSADPVNDYKTYRESEQGGRYQVLIQSIDHIYDQFNFGMPSPIAIRRFCDYMLAGGSPEHLFLIGRATNNDFDFYRNGAPNIQSTNFVPTYGHPGSDIAFSAGLHGTTLEEAIPTGRINAKTPNDVEAYLNKVIETEALIYDDLWHKNFIHLTGGQNESELNRFRNIGEEFEAIAEAPLLGAKVSKTSKKTSEAVEFFNITKEINEGAGVITFFGHSGASVTDIEVGIVSDPVFGYNNTGRYPIFVVNGCNAGDFFGSTESFGVDWVLTPELGALGFMAHSSLAFSNALRNYTNFFYTVAFAEDEYFGKTLGEIKQEVSRRYAERYSTGVFSASQIQQFVLQGDPAVKVFAADKPDYDIVDENLTVGTFDGSALLAEVDSFYIDVQIKNYGKYSGDQFLVSVKRTLPDGSEIVYGPNEFDPVLRLDTIRFTIDNQIEGTAGNNTLQVIVDQLELIEELNESNNTASTNLFMATGSTFNILPHNYSIVTSSLVNFAFQATDLLSGTRAFLLEIDTLSTFSSPYLTQQTITENVVAKVNVDLSANGAIPDGTVVYWRTKFANPLPTEVDDWVVSSFVYRGSGEGWSQTDNDQIDNTSKTGLTFDTTTGLWDFVTTELDLEVTTYGQDHPTLTYSDAVLLLDGINFFETNSPLDAGCRNNTLNIVAFDFQSTVPYNPIELGTIDVLDDRVCGRSPQFIYNFPESDFAAAVNPENLIDNMADGDHVLVFSLGTLNYSTWPASLMTKLTEIGVNQSTLDNLEDGEPIIFFGSKGSAQSTAEEIIASSTPKNEQEINLGSSVTGSFFSGELVSEKIGPALSYQLFTNNLDIASNNVDELYEFTIYGIDGNNAETALFENFQDATLDISSIDATIYPYLRVELKVEDPVDLSPSQLKSWTVEYEQAPEGILLRRDTDGLDSPISKQEGEPTSTQFTYWNLSDKNYADSILVEYKIVTQQSNSTDTDTLKIRPLQANDSINFELEINTIEKIGTNDLILKSMLSSQIETHENNNNLRLSDFLNVESDRSNPILEVSFDGNYILDGDIVSPTPNILISMKDDNQYLFKQDTTGLNFYLKKPCEGCDFERVTFSSPTVTWQAATEESDFTIEYSPQELENGIHTLQVQMSDASGNESGTEPYEINFEIVNESSITNFYPYPNPFSSSTRFVFTLTGSEIPDDLKIQIMTVTGRVVKEILREELGAIRIGNNITDYAWDGKDEFGDQLANGVYLYRVFIQRSGESVPHMATSGDKGFKNGYGKLYLLR